MNVPNKYLEDLPSGITFGNGPFREVRLLVDGQVAGVVFPYVDLRQTAMQNNDSDVTLVFGRVHGWHCTDVVETDSCLPRAGPSELLH